MYARSTSIRSNPDKLGDGVTYVTKEVLPTVGHSDGFIGLSMLTNRDDGRCIVTTSWRDAESMRATAEEARTLRHHLEHTLGSEHSDVQEWEIAILHRDRPAGDGAGAQVTWARIPTNHVDDLLAAYRENLMPKLQALPGFCSLSMMVDRRTGQTVSVTAFENRDAAGLVRRSARSLREQFAQAMGARIVAVAEMDLDLAHLHVPERA